jgi:BirA family biotin operon repressor/biotin-[acetyl-CoA-carboxylase] ligase
MKKNKHVNYIHFHCIDSTSTWAKENAAILDPHQITCITALEQTAGRGRFQRKWISPKGLNLCATFYFCVPLKSSCIPNLGQVLCISCASMLKSFGFSPSIKWPNDILLNGKKVAGILCETTQIESLQEEELLSIALGIGININTDDETLSSIDQPATSLKQLSNQEWSIEKILHQLSSYFVEDLDTLLSRGFGPFASSYDELLAFKGKHVTIQDGSRVLSGVCHSISKTGNLVLLSDTGEKIEAFAGSMICH